MRTRYLIVGYSRSGTTVTHLALMGHPNVAALNDELKPSPFFTQGLSAFTHGNDRPDERQNGYRAIFDAITSIRATENTLALGAKTANNSVPMARQMVEVLQQHFPDMKVIHVVRKDVVAQFGSSLYGARSGIMHSWYDGAASRKIRPIKIAKWSFIPYALGVLRMNQVLDKLRASHPVYVLTFEDYGKDPAAVHQALFEFVGIPVMKADWLKSEKLLPPPQEYITNYAEMTKLLHQLEHWVATDSVPGRIVWPAKVVGRLKRITSTLDRAEQRVRAQNLNTVPK